MAHSLEQLAIMEHPDRRLPLKVVYLLASLVLILCNACLSQADPPPVNTALPASRPTNIKMLTESNWQTVLKSDDEWLVMFKADWCPACKQFKSAFQNACGKQTDATPRFSCAIVDVDASPGLAGRFQSNMLPTIYHVKRGEYRRYPGHMNQKGLEDFVYDMQWQAATPVPKYWSPGSPHMRIVQEFYMLSGRALRVHDYFVKVHKLPPWTVYVMFVLAVILGGFFIGLGFVFVVDGLTWLLNRQGQPTKTEERRRVPGTSVSSSRPVSATTGAADSARPGQSSSESQGKSKLPGSRPPSKPASRAGSVREEAVKKPTVPERTKRENYAEGTLAEEATADYSASSETNTEHTDDDADKSSDASGRDDWVVNGKEDLNGEVVDTEEDTTDFAPPTKPRKQRPNASQHGISITSAGDTASTISVVGSEPASSESSYNLRPRRRRREE